MTEGPFGGPRPFAGAELVVQFQTSKDVETPSVDIEQRLRRNGFSRADVRIDKSDADSRSQITVLISEEQLSYSVLRRLIEQVKSEADVRINDNAIDVFCK